jgi:hypothetical protein
MKKIALNAALILIIAGFVRHMIRSRKNKITLYSAITISKERHSHHT